MHERLIDYSSTRKLPTGRALFVLLAILKAAEADGHADLVASSEDAVGVNRDALSLELAYQAAKAQKSGSRGSAGQIDRKLDAILGGMYSIADAQTNAEEETAEYAAEFLATVYPDGLFGLVNLSFEEQLAAEENLLERFDADLAPHLDALGMGSLAARFRALVPAFRTELERENSQKVTYPEVKDARAEGLDKFAGVIFDVLSLFKDQPDMREAYLREYHRQNEIVAEAYRRNRAVVDIDPDSGEPVVDDDDVVVEPAE